MIRELIDGMPLWGVLVTTILIVWIATEVGFRTGSIRSRKPDVSNETQISSMTGANLGLLAFLLAFTFSMAAGHFDARKKTILEEIKVLETAYMRTMLLPDDPGGAIRELIREYTVLRGAVTGDTDVAVLIRESQKLQAQMWRQVEAFGGEEAFTAIHGLLIQSINRIFEVHEDRISAGLYNRIPPSIWVALYSVLLLSMVGMGYHAGIKGTRSPVPSAALALSFSMVLFLIADLDRPTSGLVINDQSAMIELGKRLQRVEQ